MQINVQEIHGRTEAPAQLIPQLIHAYVHQILLKTIAKEVSNHYWKPIN